MVINFYRKRAGFLFAVLISAVAFYSPVRYTKIIEDLEESHGGLSKQDMMDKAWEYEFEITKDPALNTVPRERLLAAYDYAKTLEASGTRAAMPNFTWTERGPDNFGGRTRSIMVDPNDPQHKRVFAGSVGGGLWRNEDVTS